eukprot:GGOE01020508.1.p1 GENE.GGOE01020508.1~~GGOE01020508.1.p1  ORF type:complete len:614 (+),score=145.70 GGOE01020508.1:68-1843(+)
MVERADSKRVEMDDDLLEEAIQEWLETNLEVEIHDLFNDLEDGVLLCRLMERCGVKLRYRSSARKLGIFHCRDNVSQFLSGCRELNVLEAVLFNPDDLVEHKNHKQVVSCLFYMAKLLVEYGLKPSSLVKCELEIEALESAEQAGIHRLPEDFPPAGDALIGPPELDDQLNADGQELPQDGSPADEEEEGPPIGAPVPASPPTPVAPPAQETAEAPSPAVFPPPPFVPLPSQARRTTIPDASKDLVAQVSSLLKSYEELRNVTFDLVGPGQYIFQDSLMNRTGKVFVREVRGKTIVRVGGGWMSLLKFVLTKFGDSAKLHEAYVTTKDTRMRGPKYNSREEMIESNFRTDSFDMVKVPGVYQQLVPKTPERPERPRPTEEAPTGSPEPSSLVFADEGAACTPPIPRSSSINVHFRHSPPASPLSPPAPQAHRSPKSPAMGRRNTAPLTSSPSTVKGDSNAEPPKPPTTGPRRSLPPTSKAMPTLARPPTSASSGPKPSPSGKAPTVPTTGKAAPLKTATPPRPSPPKAAVVPGKLSPAGRKSPPAPSAVGAVARRPPTKPSSTASPPPGEAPGATADGTPPAIGTPAALYF